MLDLFNSSEYRRNAGEDEVYLIARNNGNRKFVDCHHI
jgi:hypothetical protein